MAICLLLIICSSATGGGGRNCLVNYKRELFGLWGIQLYHQLSLAVEVTIAAKNIISSRPEFSLVIVYGICMFRHLEYNMSDKSLMAMSLLSTQCVKPKVDRYMIKFHTEVV